MKDDKVTQNASQDAEDWRSRIIDDPDGISEIVKTMRRVAVIGIKPESVGGPAYYVPELMQHAGFDIVPVPVYYPEEKEILEKPVHRSLSTIEPKAQMVQLFRRSADVAKHVDEILAAQPEVVWMQLGIWNDEAAEKFARAGMRVVQDRCMAVEMDRRGR